MPCPAIDLGDISTNLLRLTLRSLRLCGESLLFRPAYGIRIPVRPQSSNIDSTFVIPNKSRIALL